MISLENIPSELQVLNRWVCADADSKIPKQALLEYNASCSNPKTWTNFKNSSFAVKNHMHDYVGFVFNDDGYIGIDIDDGYDEDGLLSDIALDIIAKCNSYTEKSKSGRGFHIFIKGTLPYDGKNNLKGVEIYKKGRYFITTGDVIGHQNTIIENQKAIDYVLATYFGSESDGEETSSRIYSADWSKCDGKKIKLKPIYPKIPKGARNVCLTSMAGFLRNIGYSEEHMTYELGIMNRQACEPPVSNNELRSIVKSIMRYDRK